MTAGTINSMNRNLLLLILLSERIRKILIGYWFSQKDAFNPFLDQSAKKVQVKHVKSDWPDSSLLIGPLNSDAVNPLTKNDAVNPI